MNHASVLSFEEWVFARKRLDFSVKVDEVIRKSELTLTLDQLDFEIMSGKMLAFGLYSGGKLTGLVTGFYRPSWSGVTGFVVNLAVGQLTKNAEAIADMCRLVELDGASYVEALAGAGEARLYARVGFVPGATVVRKQL